MTASLAPSIQAAILRGAHVLTPNQRAARTLRRAFEAAQSAAGKTLWDVPPILAFDSWLSTLWHALVLEGQDSRTLLNRSQEQAVWRAVLAEDRQLTGNAEALTEPAARAWRLLHLSNGAGRLDDYPAGTDARAFARWTRAFTRRLAQSAFLTAAQLPAALGQACAQGTLDLPNAGLLLVDFAPLPPAHEDLLTQLEQAGYSVERISTAARTPRPRLFPAPDDPAELHAAATWARDLLARSPQARIAIVSADQQTRRPEIERVFLEVLPEVMAEDVMTAAPVITPAAPPYEFSLGVPLTQTALADSALLLLRWTQEPLPLTAISRLLVSPFVGGSRGGIAPQTQAAARFDSDTLGTLKTLRPELTLAACLDLLKHASRHAPALLDLQTRLQALAQSASAQPATSSHAQWADSFRAALQAAGWTSAAVAESLTFQAHRRWESVLDELSALDVLGATPTAAEALRTLGQLAEAAIFAPESHDAPIQILGPLELGGAPFDALWFLAADDLAWPPAAPTSPLLSFALQRALNMPGADPAREQLAAEALTAGILAAAPEVIVSYAQRHEEGERRLSPLVAVYAPETIAFDPAPHAAPLSFEFVADTEPLAPPPDTIHQGGSSILQLQAACGFRAFAEKRLWSSAPPAAGQPREPGLDPRDRGEIVHTVMERFWREIQTQQALRDLPTETRHATLDHAIDAALRDARRLSESPWDDAYLAIQRQRLRDLLRPWLDLELTRPEFTVRAAETELVAAIGPLRLKLRVDRVDETAAGPLILDYKTGAATPSQWLTDRPEAPQLPLYAALLAQGNQAPAGVAFALLRPGETLCLKGFATEAGVLEKSSRMEAVSFDEQVEAWHGVLTTLAGHFVAGDAAVLPRDYPKTCAYCAQRILCRLDPGTLNPAALEEADEDQTQGGPDA